MSIATFKTVLALVDQLSPEEQHRLTTVGVVTGIDQAKGTVEVTVDWIRKKVKLVRVVSQMRRVVA